MNAKPTALDAYLARTAAIHSNLRGGARTKVIEGHRCHR